MPFITATASSKNLNTYQLERQKILKSYFEDIHSLLTAEISRLITKNATPEQIYPLQAIFEQSKDYVSQYSPHLDFEQYVQLLASLQPKIAGFGIDTGVMKSVKNFGIYGYALLSSADYQQFTAVADRIFNAIYEPLTISHEAVANELHICYTATSELPTNSYIPLMEQVVFCGIALMQARLPQDVDWTACRIECNYPKPTYWKKYFQHFAGEVQFDRPAMQLCVPLSWLDLSFEAGDSFIFEQCQTQIEAILGSFSPSFASNVSQESDTKNPSISPNYTQKVRELLLNTSFNPSPTIDTIAKQLRTAERTLRYRLTQEQTSFRTILNEVRFELAKRYLCKSDFSIQEIAFLLGYQHIQNFYRAFIKEAKLPPEKFRQQHRDEK